MREKDCVNQENSISILKSSLNSKLSNTTKSTPTYVYSSTTTSIKTPTFLHNSFTNPFKPASEGKRNLPFLFSLLQSNSVVMGPIVLTQLATGLSVLAGAAIVKQIMDQNPMMGPGREPRCPSCNGTGRVSCMCTRWSDGDYGCRACAGSGRAACNKCGGSGTGRPIPVQISVIPQNQPPS